MKTKYTSPTLKTDILEKQDVLLSSQNDNTTEQYQGDSLLRTIGNFVFHD